MGYMCVFPGQGSQSVGMLAELAASYPVVEETFEQASDAIGIDLWSLVMDGPAEMLDRTENTQPALLAASMACWRVLSSQVELNPEVTAGHSFGEYSALLVSEAIEFKAATGLARQRGLIMQSAVAQGEGAMAAILGLDDEPLVQLCEQLSTSEAQVEAVNFNAPGQVVIAGHRQAVDAAVKAAKDHGAKRAILLPVSVPAHSRLMRPAAEKFRPFVQAVVMATPRFDVIHNADMKAHSDSASIADALCAQLYTPVRWAQTIEKMSQAGATLCLEIGPGKVLSGLNKRINKSLVSICVCDPQSVALAAQAIEEQA